jgi:hypothetical protein
MTWSELYTAACDANVGAALLTARTRAREEIKGLGLNKSKMQYLAERRVIEFVQKPIKVPKTWYEILNIHESAVLSYAVAEALQRKAAADKGAK